MPRRGTYSIVARDPDTGELGVAVQSHWFSVGSIVSWARPGVGAVATQSIVEPAYGPRGLELMTRGTPAPKALQTLLGADSEAHVRQVAMVDKQGRVATHTGAGCIPHASHATGHQFSAQANMMARATVPGAMAQAYLDAEGPLAERLLTALDAAEAEGGDVRGRQSSCLLVVPAVGNPWDGVDLRVEDDADPLGELRRLLALHRAYELASRADTLVGEGRTAEAAPLYEQASELAPDSDELLFWAGLATAQLGDFDAGVDRVRRAIAVHDGWRELLDRLTPELAPSAEAVRHAVQTDSTQR
ncbi:MAG: hypothetical protein JWN32_4245 [Solirubrobacterales bacterium]|nr:hypothetical protein [Solirubrobacterales bacterium]